MEKMMRFFRIKKAKISAPSSRKDCITRVETLADEMEQTISELDHRLRSYKHQIEKMRECRAKNMMKAKAIRLLRRKKLYNNQVERLRNHSLKLKQGNCVAESFHHEKSKIVPQNKKNNLMSEKLSLLYQKIVKQSK